MTPTAIQLKLNADFDALFGSHVLPVILPPLPLATLPPELTPCTTDEGTTT